MESERLRYHGAPLKDEEYYTLKAFLNKHSDDFVPPLLRRRNFASNLESIRYYGGYFSFENTTPLAIVTYIDRYKGIPNIAYVPYIATAEDLRKKGIMKKLMSESIEALRQVGKEEIRLETWASNRASRRLFSCLGFKELKIIEDDRGQGIDTVEFRLKLSDFSHTINLDNP